MTKNRPFVPTLLFVLALLAACAGIAGRAADAPDKGGASGPGKAVASSASDDALTPDRPGFTNGSDTVAPSHVQIEVGVTRNKYASANGGAQATDAPEALIRTGLNAKTELRVTLPDYIWPAGGASGFSDGAVGLRYKFYQSKNDNPKLAFTPSLSVPLRSAVTTSGHVDPVLSLNAQTTSRARWSLGSNVILSYPTLNRAVSRITPPRARSLTP